MEEQGQTPDLRALREAQKLDLVALSSATSLSVAQLRELEEGGSGHFYSEAIKQQAMRRVLRHLGVTIETDPEASTLPAFPAPAAQENRGVIQGIIRLSQAGDHFEDPRFPVSRQMDLPRWVGGAAVSLGVVILLVWGYPYDQARALYAEWQTWFSAPTSHTVQVQPTLTAPAPDPVKATVPPVDAAAKEEAPSAGSALTAAPAATPLSAAASNGVTPTAVPTPAPVPVPTPAPTPAPTAPSVSNAGSPAAALGCESFQSVPVAVAPISIEKPGQYVYLIAKSASTVCAGDGQGKSTRIELSPGVGRSVYGSSPWILASKDWTTVDVYFQGSKVWIPPGTGQRVKLTEQPVPNR